MKGGYGESLKIKIQRPCFAKASYEHEKGCTPAANEQKCETRMIKGKLRHIYAVHDKELKPEDEK